jgi:penicillin-binding protein 2
LTPSDQLSVELARMRIVLAIMLGIFVCLVASLWHVQVRDVSKYRSSVDRQSIRRVRLPGTRGVILDRNGVCLAENIPSYCIAMYIEELRQPGSWSNTINRVEAVIAELSQVLRLKPEVTRENIRKHISRRLPLPFLAWRDIDQAALARWAEANVTFPGVDVYVEPVRCYPMGPLAAHLLGYVGKADPEQESEEDFYHFYLPEMEGKSGVEQAFNSELAGVAGGYLIRVNASGFKHSEVSERKPVSGKDITLTLNVRIQRLAETALSGEAGAIVVLDPRNGDVLAMASSPSFDPNSFSPSISIEEFRKLNSAESNKPLLNRAISGLYPPGSTFKPMVAITALESGRVTPDTSFDCVGYFELGDARFHCWNKSGHGFISMRKALEQSCNAYFCQLGLACDYERIYRAANALGFGHRTGIELEAEAEGLLPRKTRGWRGGDTCNISIGQGALLATPLQMAVLTMAVANGGYVYRPRIMLKQGGSIGELVTKMGWSAETMRIVRGGMHDVIEADTGTGKRAKIPGVEMAGKTGTAEYGLASNHKNYAWMTIFAPFDNPRYVVALVIEEGVSGGISAAPRINELMSGVFKLENTPVNVSPPEIGGDAG